MPPPMNPAFEAERYNEEVLNASWLPAAVLAALDSARPSRVAPPSPPLADGERPSDYLRRLYHAQE